MTGNRRFFCSFPQAKKTVLSFLSTRLYANTHSPARMPEKEAAP